MAAFLLNGVYVKSLRFLKQSTVAFLPPVVCDLFFYLAQHFIVLQMVHMPDPFYDLDIDDNPFSILAPRLNLLYNVGD